MYLAMSRNSYCIIIFGELKNLLSGESGSVLSWLGEIVGLHGLPPLFHGLNASNSFTSGKVPVNVIARSSIVTIAGGFVSGHSSKAKTCQPAPASLSQ